MVHVHTHNQNPQALRGEIAKMLGTTADHVIVHSYPGPGHYGRSNGGNAGAEDEAVILSQAVGKPVRVQWMRADDMQWSTQSSAAFSDVELAMDEKGKWWRIRSTTTCRRCRTTGRWARCSQDCRPCRRPRCMSTSVTSTVNGHFRSVALCAGCECALSAGMARSRWDRRLRRLP